VPSPVGHKGPMLVGGQLKMQDEWRDHSVTTECGLTDSEFCWRGL